MSRRQAICYLVIICVITLALLVLLAIIHPLLMLTGVLVLIIAVGLLKKYRPQVFSVFHKPTQDLLPVVRGSSLTQQGTRYSPNLIMVASNLPSIGQIVIDEPVFSLGRDAGCNFCITNAPDISRVHATLRYDSKSSASYIVDNNSHNGTFVNGTKLTPGKPKRISNGDVIQLGTIRFIAQVAHY